jgi:hypothetical protein
MPDEPFSDGTGRWAAIGILVAVAAVLTIIWIGN